MTYPFTTEQVHSSWQPLIQQALSCLESAYVAQLTSQTWLPGNHQIFNAFQLDLNKVDYILFGESPYPRAESANGYAFWDAAVHALWSEKGLSKAVNRATSLRNWIKMLLVARGALSGDNCTQEAIAALDKTALVATIDDFFANTQQQGMLLLNASLVLSHQSVAKDAKAWQPFMNEILRLLAEARPDVTLILLGKIAQKIEALPASQGYARFYAEHPYNVSFINNPAVIEFFKPLNLLQHNA